MITQYEVPLFLKKELPQMPAAVKIQASRFITTDIYASLNSFSFYTRHAVEGHHFILAKRCFVVAEKLYQQGDTMVRSLIENIFVYSFSSLLPENSIEQMIVKKIIPPNLYSIYIKQVTSGGC